MPPETPAPTGGCPARIGKYQVIDHIATGGMGTVYRATDVDNGRQVALKIISAESLKHAADVERFRREAANAAKLNHENVVKLYDSGEFENLHFLALEFVDGVDLKEYIARKQKVRPVKARRLILQAARALAHVHQQGIVHRDIKPSNFLVMKQDGRKLVKLIDLGLARDFDSDEVRITRANHTLGTIDYMAPEQARDSGLADVRSDIYSLGCTLYHMLAGHPPFPDGGPAERIYKHCEVRPPDICKLNPEVPPGLARVLRKMLAKKPIQRYQTVKELIEDLKDPEKTTGPVETELPEDLRNEEKGPKRGTAPRGGAPGSKRSDPALRQRRDARLDKKRAAADEDISHDDEQDSDDEVPQDRELSMTFVWVWVAIAFVVFTAVGVLLYVRLD